MNPEERIEQVLHALQTATPPDGLEQRILASLHGRAATRPARFTLRPSVLLATASFALALAAVSLLTLHRHPGAAQTTAAGPASANLPQPPIAASTTSPPPRPQPRTRATPHPSAAAPRTADDDLALSELHAPSHPAPPLELTQQEQLLLHIVNRRDPVQSAELDPSHREAVLIAENHDFQTYFHKTHGDTQ